MATLIDLYSQYRLNAIANQAHFAGATTAPHTGAVISTQVVTPVRSSSRRWTGRLAMSAFSIYPPQGVAGSRFGGGSTDSRRVTFCPGGDVDRGTAPPHHSRERP